VNRAKRKEAWQLFAYKMAAGWGSHCKKIAASRFARVQGKGLCERSLSAESLFGYFCGYKSD